MSDERKPWALAAALVVATALVACTPTDQPRGPAAPAPTTPTTTAASPTPTEDPYAIPDDIDKAYVERVLNALGERYAEAIREVAKAGTVDAAPRAILDDIYGPEAAEDAVDVLTRTLSEQGHQFFNPEAQVVRHEVVELVSGNEDCIFVRVRVDSDDIASSPTGRTVEEYFWLESKSEASGNPTPWLIVAEQEPPEGKEFNDPCAA